MPAVLKAPDRMGGVLLAEEESPKAAAAGGDRWSEKNAAEIILNLRILEMHPRGEELKSWLIALGPDFDSNDAFRSAKELRIRNSYRMAIKVLQIHRDTEEFRVLVYDDTAGENE